MKRNIFNKCLPGYFVFIFLLMVQYCVAQDEYDSMPPAPGKNRHWSVNGYLKDLQTVQFTDISKKWTLDNLLHNRVDIHWYADSLWKFQLGIRNRLLYGESTAFYKQHKSLLDGGNGFVDLSATIASGESFLLHSMIDRAALDYSKGKWQVTAGRQRINWGLNLVWNPNDIFNAYSYFDFDYEERPGTDAVRVQYYINSTSSSELAYKPGRHPGETVAAGLYHFNIGSYDLQFLAGIMNRDYVLGGGWSGVLGNAGFNGEISAFTPYKKFDLAKTDVSASAGVNYTFPNSLYLHGTYLFSSAGVSHGDSLSAGFFLNNVSAKLLSPSRHSFFAECAYQFSPLIRGDLSGIINPADGSFFIGPFVTFSLTNTLELLTAAQLFIGKQNSIYGGYGQAVFFRFKWSF